MSWIEASTTGAQSGVNGGMVTRAVRVFLILDTSGSMKGEKIAALNAACVDAIDGLKKEAQDQVKGHIELSVLSFSTGAQWLGKATNVDQFQWVDLTAGGRTDMGHAFREVAKELDEAVMPKNAFAPVLVLVSDGGPTDDWKAGLKALNDMRWAKVAARAAITVGPATKEDMLNDFLDQFHDENLFTARNSQDLAKLITWVSVELSKSVSRPMSKTKNPPTESQTGSLPPPVGPAPLPPPPKSSGPVIW